MGIARGRRPPAGHRPCRGRRRRATSGCGGRFRRPCAVAPAAVASVEVWITPPAYTGWAPLRLAHQEGDASASASAGADASDKRVRAPAGSTILAQVSGVGRDPRLVVGGDEVTLTPLHAAADTARAYRAETVDPRRRAPGGGCRPAHRRRVAADGGGRRAARRRLRQAAGAGGQRRPAPGLHRDRRLRRPLPSGGDRAGSRAGFGRRRGAGHGRRRSPRPGPSRRHRWQAPGRQRHGGPLGARVGGAAGAAPPGRPRRRRSGRAQRGAVAGPAGAQLQASGGAGHRRRTQAPCRRRGGGARRRRRQAGGARPAPRSLRPRPRRLPGACRRRRPVARTIRKASARCAHCCGRRRWLSTRATSHGPSGRWQRRARSCGRPWTATPTKPRSSG